MTPGIERPRIRSNSSTRTNIARSMSTATRSSSASSAMSRTGSLFGIYAQRSTTGLGLHNNYLKYNSSATSALRHSLNDNRTPLFNNIGFMPMPHHHEDNSNKFMGIMMGVGMGIGLLNTIMKGIADLKAADGTDGTEGAKPKSSGGKDTPSSVSPDSLVNTNVAESVKNMQNATNSSTLRSAISSAQTELSQLKADYSKLEEAATAASGQLKDLEPKISAKKEEVSEAKEARDTAETNKKDAEGIQKERKSTLDKAVERLGQASEAQTNAQNNLVSARQALGAAKSTLASTPQYITDASGKSVENPAYQQAKDAVEDAELKVNEAEQELKKANDAFKQANSAKADAVKGYELSVKQFAEAEENLANKTAAYEKLNTEYEKLKTELENLEKQKTEAEKAVTDFNNAKSTITALEAEIPKQQTRLAELEQQEQNGLASAENTILSLQNKMAGKDGILGNDDDRKLRRKDQDKYDDAIATQRNVNYTNLYKQKPTMTLKDGTELRIGSYNGEMLYMIDEKPVSASDYMAKKDEYNKENYGDFGF